MTTRYIGNAISGTWSGYVDVDTWTDNYYFYVDRSFGVYFNKKHEHTMKYDSTRDTFSNGNVCEYDKGVWSGNKTKGAGETYYMGWDRFLFPRFNYSYTISFTHAHSHTGSGAQWKGTSSVYISLTVPARANWAVTYNGGASDVTNVPAMQTKYYGYSLLLSGTTPSRKNFTFVRWDGSDGNAYYPNGAVYGDYALTLTAKWSDNHPPTIDDIGNAELGGIKTTDGTSALKHFTSIKVPISGIYKYSNRTISSIVLTYSATNPIATMQATLTQSDLTYDSSTGLYSGEFEIPASDVTESGTFTGTITITDSSVQGYSSTYTLADKLVVIDPTWTKQVTFDNDVAKPPSQTTSGTPILTSLEVMKYVNGVESGYELFTVNAPVTLGETSWSFPFTFTEDYVSAVDELNPTTKVRVAYTHYDVVETPHRHAFFETSRNQNYSNGIYNTVFVSGVDPQVAPNFTSRVWWCYINDPLYFPDTNYVEVGSNDTSVQGLTKVGDYLATVKQSKTTDTAIYLLYPTSFEEETTYAVKQGVQGVGALARYSFNILGDETLFLSPNGVMAIVPTQDEEHKTQNRSYFIDGKLLKEDLLSDAYSFVFDGKYWLALNGHCYVLDGNQRNSWGNDRTNLVYECYFLDNVPANCFVKYRDMLVFSTDSEVCKFKDGQGADSYVDAFDYLTDEPNVPVKAEWSTIFDDDNSLHYYKTMQKKGNLVSILPTDYLYSLTVVDEETFNEDKTLYYTFDGTKYTQCTKDSVYDPTASYYTRVRSATKIFVKKDEKEPVEIERSFSYSSDIPSEMYLNKKFKKYKRLQFIIKNDEAEPFGIDEIVKNYTIGNYAKR